MGTQGRRRPNAYAGFTLVEQVVVVTVLAVLLGMAIPAMGGLLARHELASAQMELAATLQHARALAVSSRRRVLLCPSRDGQQCTDDTHWESGWALGRYRSSNADQLDGLPTLVHAGYRRLTMVSTAGRKRVRFQPDGTTGGSNISFTLCRAGTAAGALSITVSNMGRVSGSNATADQARSCAQSG